MSDQTCRVCGGTWASPKLILPRGRGAGYATCPADCHDEEKWKALAELAKDHSRLVIVQECLRNEVEDTATLRTRIAELVAAREEKTDG